MKRRLVVASLFALLGSLVLTAFAAASATALPAHDIRPLLLTSTLTLSDTQRTADQLPPVLRAILQSDVEGTVEAPLPVALPNACAAPVVINGSIITGTNPTTLGRLIRNGVPSACGIDYACSGVQSTGTSFAYQDIGFINSSAEWQCVQVTMDSRSCTQQVYSAAYLNSFNTADLCQNIQGAMGFSTSGVYGYSFMVPPATNFRIVNNTTGVVPPSSNCASYTMTTTLCSTNLGFTASQQPESPTVLANSVGQAVVPISVTYTNTGDYAVSVDASMISETVQISVQDGQPAAVQATLGKGGGIIQPGASVTQRIVAQFSGSQFTCLPRVYTLNNQMQAAGSVYHCDGFNPPASVIQTGSVSPQDNFDEDSFAFQSLPGTLITATVDTVSAATAFDIEACISATPNGTCLPGLQGDDDFTCTFPPPSFKCPQFGGTLPTDSDGDNIYYLRINSGSGASNFVGPSGEYRASILITSGPTGACPLIPALDNGVNSFLRSVTAPAGLTAAPSPTITVMASVQPVTIIVPPSNPSAPGCSQVFLPTVLK